MKKLLHKATKTQAKYPDSKPEGPPVEDSAEAQGLRLLEGTGAVRGAPLGLGLGRIFFYCTSCKCCFSRSQHSAYGGRKSRVPLAFHPKVKLEENTIVIVLANQCVFSTIEHKLEIFKNNSDPERTKKILEYHSRVPPSKSE